MKINKKILIGSMLVVILFLIMPSIPAIQQKTIRDSIETRENILLERLRDINVEKIKDLLNQYDGIPPLLGFIIEFIFLLRYWRGVIFQAISMSYLLRNDKLNNLLLLRGVWLQVTSIAWVFFWVFICTLFGWIESPPTFQ